MRKFLLTLLLLAASLPAFGQQLRVKPPTTTTCSTKFANLSPSVGELCTETSPATPKWWDGSAWQAFSSSIINSNTSTIGTSVIEHIAFCPVDQNQIAAKGGSTGMIMNNGGVPSGGGVVGGGCFMENGSGNLEATQLAYGFYSPVSGLGYSFNNATPPSASGNTNSVMDATKSFIYPVDFRTFQTKVFMGFNQVARVYGLIFYPGGTADNDLVDTNARNSAFFYCHTKTNFDGDGNGDCEAGDLDDCTWRAITCSDSTCGSTDLGATYRCRNSDNAIWRTFKIVKDSDTSWSFYIDGTLVTTRTTVLPITAVDGTSAQTFPAFIGVWHGATANINVGLTVDYVYYSNVFR